MKSKKLKIKNKTDAIYTFAEFYSWAKLANIFAAKIVSGDYPAEKDLAKVLTDDWNERIEGLMKQFGDWLGE